ncbi:MAG: hypothetical protein ACQR33_06260 [Candidatus Saccharibacteria bacterium]
MEYEYEPPYAADTQDLRELAHAVGEGAVDAQSVARVAVCAGFLLIGTTVPKIRHYPVSAKQHRYRDLRAGYDKQFVPDGVKMLEAGTNADVAILCGLFGDYNDERQRSERCSSILGHDDPKRIGWGNDIYKTFSHGMLAGEDGHMRPHARPELINAALDTKNPLTGYIDCVYGHPLFRKVVHDRGQLVAPVIRRTVFSIPLVGCLDLPPDIIATDYIDTTDQALLPDDEKF